MATDSSKSLNDVYAYLCIFFVFYVFLRILLNYARKNINKEYPIPKSDEFFKQYGYSFDYVFVFAVHDEKYTAFSDYQIKFSMGNVITRLNNAGLDTKYFYSVQRDEIYIKVRASPERLRTEASKIDYRLMLDPDRLRSKALLGKKSRGEYIWKPILITDEYNVSNINPYQFIYAPYDANANHEELYKLYSAMNNHKHIFRGVDRINLLISMMQGKLSSSPPGAGLNISKLIASKAVLAAFPLHDYEELKSLQLRWLNLYDPPWKQPIDEIKNYFGERIALYFLYLQHYVEYLIVPALLGAITFIVQKGYNLSEIKIMPFFATYMIIWTSFFQVFWRRKQSMAAMKWGTAGFEDVEQDRPLFEGININSPVNGREMTYFPNSKKMNRTNIALSVTFSLICCVIAIVIGIYVFQFWLNQPQRQSSLNILGLDITPVIGSLLNATVIVVLNIAYQDVAIRLTEYENHRTDTQFEDYLITKVFVFQLVNSFSGLTYIAFVKAFMDIKCSEVTCTADVASTLSTVFLSSLLTRAIIEIFYRKFNQDRKYKRETSGLPPGVHPTPIEEQYILDSYPAITGTLSDYASLVVQYGYTVLFVAAFPLAPTISIISSFIQIRIDGWKLCQAFRRPQPRTAEDIGVWQDMIQILSMLGVMYNFGLIFFTGGYLRNSTWYFRWIAFIIFEHLALILHFLISKSVSEISEEVKIQLERQEFFISKVIRNAEDEKEDNFTGSKLNLNFVIHDFDDDWIDIENFTDDKDLNHKTQ